MSTKVGNKAQNYIFIREENISYFSGKILGRMTKHYRAKVVLMKRNNDLKDFAIEINKNLVVFQYANLSSAMARRKSGNSSAIFLNQNNFLEHVPTIDRKPRAMAGLGIGPYALIVQTKANNKFEIRNLTSRKGKCFDNGICFSKHSTSRGNAVAAVFGDLHEKTHSKPMFARMVNYAKYVRAPHVVLHDVFDAISINHHELHSSLFIVNKIANGIGLEDEVQSLAVTLNILARQFKKISVVESNHDNFLDKVIVDNETLERTAELDKILLYKLKVQIMEDILAKKEDEPTLQKLLRMRARMAKNVVFLNQDQIVTAATFIISLHGDKGANGARFNYKTTTHPRTVTGHNHTGGYFNDNFSAGHCTDLAKQSYAKGGLSSWTYSMVVVYPNETCQLITFFEGV